MITYSPVQASKGDQVMVTKWEVELSFQVQEEAPGVSRGKGPHSFTCQESVNLKYFHGWGGEWSVSR